MEFDYHAEDFLVEIPLKDYVSQYNDLIKFNAFCKECKNYNRLWVCPPFTSSPLKELKQYSNILLIATRITPADRQIPISYASDLMKQERFRIEKSLITLEKKYNGKALAFAGNCLYCEPGTCSRISNNPCRHPDKARPSLEAYGFDIGKTMTDLFNHELLWSKDGFIPPYLTLVCGLLHNHPNSIKSDFNSPEV